MTKYFNEIAAENSEAGKKWLVDNSNIP